RSLSADKARSPSGDGAGGNNGDGAAGEVAVSGNHGRQHQVQRLAVTKGDVRGGQEVDHEQASAGCIACTQGIEIDRAADADAVGRQYGDGTTGGESAGIERDSGRLQYSLRRNLPRESVHKDAAFNGLQSDVAAGALNAALSLDPIAHGQVAVAGHEHIAAAE